MQNSTHLHLWPLKSRNSKVNKTFCGKSWDKISYKTFHGIDPFIVFPKLLMPEWLATGNFCLDQPTKIYTVTCSNLSLAVIIIVFSFKNNIVICLPTKHAGALKIGFWREGKAEVREKTFYSKGEKQLLTQPTYGVDAETRRQAILVWGKNLH